MKKNTQKNQQSAADERRYGVERRMFAYTVYIPERRRGRERRTPDAFEMEPLQDALQDQESGRGRK
jgi:hypothetical protein